MLHELLEHAPYAVAVLDRSHRLEWANRAYFEMTGTDGKSVGLDFFSSWPGDGATLRPAIDGVLSTRNSVELRSLPISTAGRRAARYADVHIRSGTGDPSTAPFRAILTLQEVTDRVREQERARLFYQAFQTSTNAMEVTDLEGVLVDVNPAFESIYGYSRHEAIGKKPSLVRSRHTSADFYSRLWGDLLDPARGHWSGEIVNQDRLGRERPVLLTITSVRDETGAATHYLGVAVDLTERKAWEQAAAHADKLASLGQLAAGVAHEINTPLANVLLVAESIRRKTHDEWVRSRVDTIREQVRVADRIVLGLLDFARRNVPHIAPLDLASVSHDAVAFVRGKQSPEVEVSEVYPPEPVIVQGDRNQLIQVIANILNNAYDALEGTGRVAVELRSANGFATLEVTDSGPGIPPNVLPHLFEPFFTTKPEGRGTGLGLAICHGIVQAHHGTIVASNGPGGGARFTLNFPVEGAPPGNLADAPRSSSGRPPEASRGS